VQDLGTHRKRLGEPDGYRPGTCPHCDHEGLHRHGYRSRSTRNDPDHPEVFVLRLLCPQPYCRAAWQVLPEFLPRFLGRRWQVIEEASLPPPSGPACGSADPAPAQDSCVEARPVPAAPVPERTVRRWRARLASSARHLVALLVAAGSRVLELFTLAPGTDATRGELVLAHAEALEIPAGRRLAALAEQVHRLAPGMRVM
jgi:hypothetical protein